MSAETLRKAAAIVRERGLAKGSYVRPDGRVCAEGALCMALGGSGRPSGLYPNSKYREFVLAADVLKAHIGNVPVTVWNDADERTEEDVAAAFEAAAARLDAP